MNVVLSCWAYIAGLPVAFCFFVALFVAVLVPFFIEIWHRARRRWRQTADKNIISQPAPLKQPEPIKATEPTLEIEFISPRDIDLRTLCWLMQVKIKYTHPSRTLKNVKVRLVKIEWNAAYPGKIPLTFKTLKLPVFLPVAESEVALQFDLPPAPFEQSVDVFIVRGDSTCSDIGIAPFIRLPNAQNTAQAKGGEFRAMDYGGPEGVFRITLQAIGDDIPTIETCRVLRIPATRRADGRYNTPLWEETATVSFI